MAFGLKIRPMLTERRRRDRRDIAIPATMNRPGEDPVPVEIELISSIGFLARTSLAFPKDMVLRIGFQAPDAACAGRVASGKQGRLRVSDQGRRQRPAPRAAAAGAGPALRFFAQGTRLGFTAATLAAFLERDQYELF